MWWATFQCLCEVARAIVAYGGLTQALFEGLSYIRRTPRLRKRLLWLDVNTNLFFPDRIEEQWRTHDVPSVPGKDRVRRRKEGVEAVMPQSTFGAGLAIDRYNVVA